MAWCPICKSEYREGLSNCKECDSQLVEKLIADEGEIKDTVEHFEDVAFLTSVKNETEAEVLEAMLRSFGIPSIKRYKGAEAYLKVYGGIAALGIDIYVPDSQLEKAQELIKTKDDESIEVVEGETSEIERLENSYNKKRRIGAWLIILILMPGLLVLALVGIANLMRR